MGKPTLIKDINHLRELCPDGEQLDCFVALAGGAARSSKTIYVYPPKSIYNGGKKDHEEIVIYHDISDTFTTTKDMVEFRETVVWQALQNKALFKHNF